MSSGFGPQITPVLPSESRTLYEAPGWGNLSTEDIEAIRGRIEVFCPELAPAIKIRSVEAALVIEIPSIATDEQIARLRKLLLVEAALRAGPANTPAVGDE
jgi:hypothetical protein